MKMMSLFLLLNSIFFSLAHAEIDLVQLQSKLKSTGLIGEIHGSTGESGTPENSQIFVFTYRNPNDFFDNIQLPLTSEDSAILAQLKNLKRHQFYNVKGDFFTNKAPIKHINVSSLDLVKDYNSELDLLPYKYKGDVNDLKMKTEFVGRVHAKGLEGKMMVIEYKDRIVPVFVTEPTSQAIVNTLYRGDLVRVKIRVRSDPQAPTHISLASAQSLPAGTLPIVLLESLVKTHGNPISKSGHLIKFPKSPQINTNIYALLVEDPEGTSIQYTLTNFDSPDLFKKVREKLEKVWDENLSTIENDRNKLVNRKLLVHAKGISNMVDAGQANPQILVNSLDELTIDVQK
jgi:hypothetical protein